jgi:hypothetical protein
MHCASYQSVFHFSSFRIRKRWYYLEPCTRRNPVGNSTYAQKKTHRFNLLVGSYQVPTLSCLDIWREDVYSSLCRIYRVWIVCNYILDLNENSCFSLKTRLLKKRHNWLLSKTVCSYVESLLVEVYVGMLNFPIWHVKLEKRCITTRLCGFPSSR